MSEIKWDAEGPELTISQRQASAIADLAGREAAAAIRIRQHHEAAGQTSEDLQVSTWDPFNKWFGPYTIRKSGHVIRPGAIN